MKGWIRNLRNRVVQTPQLAIVLGGTLVTVVVAAVLLQMRQSTEGVAEVRRPATKTNSTGTAKVQSPRRAQNMARITTAAGRIHQISRDELARECINRIGVEVLDEMINRAVIEMACRQRGVTVSDAEVKQEVVRLCKETGVEPSNWYQILEARHNMTPQQYHQNRIWPTLALKKLVGTTVQVTRKDLQHAYEHHFGPRVKVRLIVYDNFRRANEGWNALRSKPAEFERIAKKDSIEPNSRSLGGLIPPIRRHSQNPKLEAEAFKLKVGEVSGIVQYGTPARFAILKCEGRTQSEFKLPEVQEYLVKQLKDQKSQEAMARFLETLKGQTRVDNYLTNASTGGTTRQAGFNQPTGKKSSGQGRRAPKTTPRRAPLRPAATGGTRR